ncbi:DUF3450 domain-containing protein [Candidatus Marinarcus aquaticus]|uniref:DUF3450 domain-containing protein n=1 Tax=Candidatus Marinarcus aquaticus TaxID=2044504 RepID=A0A4V1LNY7_9BACT|nr:DUF3450 domain-containing protein [Candidatus Marinarcus aquaticus]RXJ57660.1 hypothetical protein CRV04_07565 [Candidatus Marinarcus aquaticus]
MKAVLILFLCLQSLILANPIDQSMQVIEQTNKKLKEYQAQINNVDEEREVLLGEYKYTNAELKNSRIYNNQLRGIIQSQKDEMINIDEQLVQIEKTQKNIFPLMLQMVESLKNLVKMDMPFLLEERMARVQRLEDALTQADIKTAEKYRIILEAFKIEYDYANSIESYQDKIDDKTYTILRLGRTALYFQSLDLTQYGYWNKELQQWVEIDDSTAKSNIRKAIKIAKKEQNVDFLELPFLAKKESK